MEKVLPHQRLFAQAKFYSQISESFENQFEVLFSRLMELRHSDYVPVRTHGALGDQGADGLTLQSRKLYACYGPQTFSKAHVRSKYRSDLAKAVSQREGEFDTFVFVHNDQRGIHPEVVSLMAEAAKTHRALKFEQMGPRKLWYEAMRFDLAAVRELLQCDIPIKEARYGIGLAELEELLRHLRESRQLARPDMPLAPPPQAKLDYSRIGADYRQCMINAMSETYLVEHFYSGVIDHTEHDEVAQGFQSYYRQIREEYGDEPDEIMWQMEVYVIGNLHAKPERLAAARVIVAHFFERCDIFERPPDGWTPPTRSDTTS